MSKLERFLYKFFKKRTNLGRSYENVDLPQYLSSGKIEPLDIEKLRKLMKALENKV